MSGETFQWTEDLFCAYLRSMLGDRTLEGAEADFCTKTGITPEALKNTMRQTVVYVPPRIWSRVREGQ
jgi:hypothetical protein